MTFPERAMMIHPSGAYGLFVSGGGNIETMIAKGWLFLASDRNRLAREVELYELRDNKPAKVNPDSSTGLGNGRTASHPHSRLEAPDGASHHKRGEDAGATPVKRGPGRPRKADKNA